MLRNLHKKQASKGDGVNSDSESEASFDIGASDRSGRHPLELPKLAGFDVRVVREETVDHDWSSGSSESSESSDSDSDSDDDDNNGDSIDPEASGPADPNVPVDILQEELKEKLHQRGKQHPPTIPKRSKRAGQSRRSSKEQEADDLDVYSAFSNVMPIASPTRTIDKQHHHHQQQQQQDEGGAAHHHHRHHEHHKHHHDKGSQSPGADRRHLHPDHAALDMEEDDVHSRWQAPSATPILLNGAPSPAPRRSDKKASKAKRKSKRRSNAYMEPKQALQDAGRTGDADAGYTSIYSSGPRAQQGVHIYDDVADDVQQGRGKKSKRRSKAKSKRVSFADDPGSSLDHKYETLKQRVYEQPVSSRASVGSAGTSGVLNATQQSMRRRSMMRHNNRPAAPKSSKNHVQELQRILMDQVARQQRTTQQRYADTAQASGSHRGSRHSLDRVGREGSGKGNRIRDAEEAGVPAMQQRQQQQQQQQQQQLQAGSTIAARWDDIDNGQDGDFRGVYEVRKFLAHLRAKQAVVPPFSHADGALSPATPATPVSIAGGSRFGAAAFTPASQQQQQQQQQQQHQLGFSHDSTDSVDLTSATTFAEALALRFSYTPKERAFSVLAANGKACHATTWAGLRKEARHVSSVLQPLATAGAGKTHGGGHGRRSSRVASSAVGGGGGGGGDAGTKQHYVALVFDLSNPLSLAHLATAFHGACMGGLVPVMLGLPSLSLADSSSVEAHIRCMGFVMTACGASAVATDVHTRKLLDDACSGALTRGPLPKGWPDAPWVCVDRLPRPKRGRRRNVHVSSRQDISFATPDLSSYNNIKTVAVSHENVFAQAAAFKASLRLSQQHQVSVVADINSGPGMWAALIGNPVCGYETVIVPANTVGKRPKATWAHLGKAEVQGKPLETCSLFSAQ